MAEDASEFPDVMNDGMERELVGREEPEVPHAVRRSSSQ